MNKIEKYFFIFVLAVVFSILPLKPTSAEVGGYIGIWGGYTISPDASSGDSHYWDHYYNNFDLDMGETWAAGGKIGYTPPPLRYVSFEFEYSFLHPDIKRSLLARYGPDYLYTEGDLKLNNFMFNAIAKYPFGIFHPYVGAGIGCSYSDMTATATQSIGGVVGSFPVGKDYTAFAWQVLTGVEINMTKNLLVDLGYRYFSTEFEFENNTDFNLGNNSKIDFTTSMVTLGLKFLF